MEKQTPEAMDKYKVFLLNQTTLKAMKRKDSDGMKISAYILKMKQ